MALAHTVSDQVEAAYRRGDLFEKRRRLISPLRPQRFVTRKIVEAAYRIQAGAESHVTLGNLDIARDWGWAPDYVEAMWKLLQAPTTNDIVIATGRTVSLRYFVECAFAHFGLDWKAHVRLDNALLRPSDISHSAANVTMAKERLGWAGRRSIQSRTWFA